MPFFADFYIFAVKKLFLCIGIEKFEKYLTEICGFLPVIAALLSLLPVVDDLAVDEVVCDGVDGESCEGVYL